MQEINTILLRFFIFDGNMGWEKYSTRIKYKNLLIPFLISFILICNSCVLDEFRFNEIRMNENWGMDIVAPLFKADLEFFQLVDDWETRYDLNSEETKTILFENGGQVPIPSHVIFEPASIIDSFAFLIDGNYSLAAVDLEFVVTNSCPFPLNIQLDFFSSNDNDRTSPVLPGEFDAGEPDGQSFKPILTKQKITLTSDQLERFNTSNRMELSTWFSPNDLINQQNTFKAEYPVKVTVLLYGVVARKKDE